MLVLPLLESIEIPKDPEKRNSLLGLADKPETKKQFIGLLQDVLLLPYGFVYFAYVINVEHMLKDCYSNGIKFFSITSDAEVPAAMSSYTFKRVIVNGWKAEELENFKKGICRFLCSGVFSDQDILHL